MHRMVVLQSQLLAAQRFRVTCLDVKGIGKPAFPSESVTVRSMAAQARSALLEGVLSGMKGSC